MSIFSHFFKKSSEITLGERLWKGLGSIKLMIVILSLLAVTAIVGTFIIQEPQAQKPITEIYDAQTLHWLEKFGLLDLYHSPWFVALLAAFAINLIIGTIQIWPKNIRLIKKRPFPLHRRAIEHFRFRKSFNATQSQVELKKSYLDLLSDRFYRAEILSKDPDGFQIFLQKGRFSKLIVFFIHLSLMVIIVGGFIGAFWGFEGNVNIAEGETVNYYFSGPKLERRVLPFALRCDDFQIEYYPGTDQPKSYKSDLKVISEGEILLQKTISVNDPLRHQGISFYQASYGLLESPTFLIRLMDRKTNKEYLKSAKLHEEVQVREERVRFKMTDFTPSFEQFGPAAKLEVFEKGKGPLEVLVLKDYPKFDAFHRKARYTYILDKIEERYFTGLQLGANPGFKTIVVGSAMLIFGLFLSYIWAFRKFWVMVEGRAPQGSRVTVVGKTTKFQSHFEKEFSEVVRRLQEVS
ncbi:MAG: cytochrome c biogenesis protein ResB [Deltaproteobacteria bacterium]